MADSENEYELNVCIASPLKVNDTSFEQPSAALLPTVTTFSFTSTFMMPPQTAISVLKSFE